MDTYSVIDQDLGYFPYNVYLLILLLAVDFESISTAPWRETKYSFTFLVSTNRREARDYLGQTQIHHLPWFRQLAVLPFILLLFVRRFGVASTFLGWPVLEDIILCSLTALLISSCARAVKHSFVSSSMSSGVMHFSGINNNRLKDGWIHLLPPVLRSEIPLNFKIILVFLVVPLDGTRGTVVRLYHIRNI